MSQPEPGLSRIQNAVLEHLPKLGLPPGARVLDAPCGAAALSVGLKRRGFEVWGADVDRSAEARLDGRFRRADLNSPLPWDDGAFDAVFSIEGFEHLENGFAFLREARRVLKPGGLLVLTTPNIVSLRSRVRYFASGFFHKDPRPLDEDGHHPLHHIGLTTFPELRYALHTSGFRLLEVGCTHWKAVSLPYAVYIPWMWLYTALAFRKEKDPEQRRRNREILGTLFSLPALFGENLRLTARRLSDG